MAGRKTDYQGPSPVVGISSLLTLFLILCLIVFACLSLASAKSDHTFALKNAEGKTAYCNACNQAEENIAAELAAGTSGSKAWSIDIDASRTLEVEVTLTGGKYSVNRWQTVIKNTDASDNEGTMQLLDLG